MCLMIFQKGKKLSQTIKTETKNSQKLGLFQRGQSMVLVKHLKIFHLFIFRKISQHNAFDNILERKKAFLDYKKQKVKTVKNWDFSKGVSPWFWSKILKFSTFLFLAKLVSIMRLTIFQKGKKLFQTIKNTKLKKSKIGIFPKGLVHGFGQKFENSPCFYFWQNQLAKCV